MNETVKEDNSLLTVHLRIRFSKTDYDYDDVYKVDEENPNILITSAPEFSETHKNATRNHALPVQKFKFSRIYMPRTSQAELFETTALPMLDECLNMENNCLLFTYGVTASGKTHTVQGPRNDAGLLPRSLDLIFNTLGSHIKPKSLLCPTLYNGVCKMTEKVQAQKEIMKQRIMCPPNFSQDMNITGLSSDANSTKGTGGSLLSEYEEGTSYVINDNVTVELQDAANVEYSVWVSYVELYNENIYDLLHQPPHPGEIRPKERPILRLGEDQSYSVYVKGATDVEVCSFAEATRVLAYGQRNRKMAATSVNQRSSRSHAIFKITVIARNTVTGVHRNSQMTFVDLAGSERYTKTNTGGIRLKEAGNINTSLLTLGKCIASLRHNSRSRNSQQIVPFRESKLTRMFKNFLSGDGRITMIVCVNPNPELFDETIHALKFSAIASETMLIPKLVVRTSADPTTMTSEMKTDFEYELRQKIAKEYSELIKDMNRRHQEDMEDLKEREREYYEGIEENIHKWNRQEMEILKDKIREARANNGNERINVLEEEKTKLAEENNTLRTDLKKLIAESQASKKDFDEMLFHAKLELKTTQQIFNEEKQRILSENAELFKANEESVTTSAFWEKEYNTVKADHAKQLEEQESSVRQYQIRAAQLENECRDKQKVLDELSKQNLELKSKGAASEALKTEVEQLKRQLISEKEAHVNVVNSLTAAETKITELESKITEYKKLEEGRTEEVTKLKESIRKNEMLQKNCQESSEVISNLKVELKELQKVLSSQEGNKENLKVDAISKDNMHLREKLMEKEKTISELESELSEIVRSKSLQFDTLISKKEEECDQLTATLEEKSNLVTSLEKRVTELQDLAGVQKDHLATVEVDSRNHIEELKRELQTTKDKLSNLEAQSTTTASDETDVKNISSVRLINELAKQEADRLQIELAALKRAHAEEVQKLMITIEAKDIEIKNWYTEKEKAVKLIAAKKEKEIEELEHKLSLRNKEIENINELRVVTPAKPACQPINTGDPTESEEYKHLAEESTRKLTEMADMVVQLESERDGAREEYEAFKKEINEAISEKEKTFKELRGNLAAQTKRAEEEADKNTELEQTLRTLRQEMDVIKKRQLSGECGQWLENSDSFIRRSVRLRNQSLNDTGISLSTRRSNRINTSTVSYASSKARSSQASTKSVDTSDTTLQSNRSKTGKKSVAVRTSTRRTSQVLLTKSAINAPRSRRNRIQPVDEDSPLESAGVKRKNTFKGLKNLITSVTPSPRPKRGKTEVVVISDSDSDFVVTPVRLLRSNGKRKLQKSQISSPDLIPPPKDRAVKDVTPETTLSNTEKITRSRTRLIQSHLSGSNRKTRSRV